MQKIKDTIKYQWYQRKRAWRELKNRHRYRLWRSRKNRLEQGISKQVLKDWHEGENIKWQYPNKIEAPIKFSFIENTEEVVKFIQKIEILFEKRKRVFVALKQVKEIDYGAIVVLLSIMIKFKSHNILFNGDFPNDYKAKELLIDSGFFENLQNTFKEKDEYEISRRGVHGIYTHARKCVDSELTANIITSASKIIWGEERRCQGAQRVLVELMHNTNNHAEIGKKGEKHWWLSVRHDKENRKVSFAFVDFGVGVFKSLDNKPSNSKWSGWANKLQKRVRYGDNADVLRLLMEGDFHRIVTEKYYRGKGLPGIAEVEKRNQISNLRIVTNDVCGSFDNTEYRRMKTYFNGTFVYWELNKDNESCK